MRASFCLAAFSLLQSSPGPGDGGPAAIRVADLKAHIGFLASDELMGREAGTPWNDVASRYIAREFELIGLKPVCDEGKSWFQPFDVGSKETRNVLGFLPGTDAELKKQIVVIGAHFDHVGLGRFGSLGSTADDKIHNGADDNASGTAGMLELAGAFAAAPCKRSLLFMAFSAEELGLLGSKHYVDNPELPLADTVAMINLDMLGRSVDDYLFIGGLGTATDGMWQALVDKHVKPCGFKLETGPGGQAPSDNTNFYLKKIPCLFFFTNVHEDYHRSTDHANKINYEGEARILKAALGLIRDLADAPQAPTFKRADGMAMPKDFEQRMSKMMAEDTRKAAKARHGKSDRKDGDEADQVAKSRPAATKGAGPDATPADLPTSRDASGKGAKAAKAETPQAPRRGVLGVSLDARGDSGPFVIATVKADSAAAAAGLAAGDEIVELDGKAPAALADMAGSMEGRKAGDKVKIKIRRDGGTRDVEVTLKPAPE